MILNPTAFKAKFDVLFANNSIQAIRASTMRIFNQDLTDSAPTWGGGGGTGLVGSSVQTTGALDFSNIQLYVYTITGISSPKSISHVNATNAISYDIILQITNVAGVLTFPSTYKMADTRWDGTAHTWTPDNTGYFIGRAVFDGTNWNLTISESPYA